MKLVYIFSLIIFLWSCAEHKKTNTYPKKIEMARIDSFIKIADSAYSKPYKRTDFVTAYFYVNKKDSSVMQLMKDSFETIRQVIVSKKNIRTHYAQYYPNGQLMADLPLDESGLYNGDATYYFPNGRVRESGKFVHGLYTGEWKNFDTKGKPLSSVKYDNNGNIRN
jgi:hypothetical protein